MIHHIMTTLRVGITIRTMGLTDTHIASIAISTKMESIKLATLTNGNGLKAMKNVGSSVKKVISNA